MHKRQFLAAAMAAAALPAIARSAPAGPRGPALLTITGSIDKPNRGPFDAVRDQMMHKQKISFERARAFDFAALIGGGLGFLWYNAPPAAVFMGDTGSMFLGGMVTALAFIMGRPELVFFFGIVYIWDAMTVVIQRVYFKLTHGKRIFRMTPIHHAFEMRGWKEVKIDFFFSLIAIIGVVLGLMYVYMA